ncbi:unnamed protein product [Plutella xylostella]|uniref:(diamondback moth) hypothetical protein n=1 Tax=Plutella xylostella TaxID=51655 RepID=A0A8S4F6J4_PLUXY|nr:unnamed protein product [Plutella xylostella]
MTSRLCLTFMVTSQLWPKYLVEYPAGTDVDDETAAPPFDAEMALRSLLLRSGCSINAGQTRCLHGRQDTAGVARLREVLEDRLQEIRKAKTWKHERVLTSPQDTKVTVHGAQGEFLNFCANNYLGLSAGMCLCHTARGRRRRPHGAGHLWVANLVVVGCRNRKTTHARALFNFVRLR